jgi:uncharacterized protein YdeI (YjbR/CyaY-like superfamily)
MDQLERISFQNRDEWRNWLIENHAVAKGIWLVYYKKHTGKPSVPYNDAVEEALCFGWIDSIVKRIDEECYMQKFTPRNDGSTWSELNKKRVDKMIALGKMTEFGLKKIEIAKQNGKWDEVVESQLDFVLSENLLDILKSDKSAFTEYEKLPPSHKKMHTSWIMTAKKEETKIRRMEKMIAMLKKGQRMF